MFNVKFTDTAGNHGMIDNLDDFQKLMLNILTQNNFHIVRQYFN